MDADVVQRARDDVQYFARVVAGAELWSHQAEVAVSDARYRVILAGRRAGKSRILAVLALHAAFRKPGASVVIVSVGEVASLRVLADVAALAGAPLLRGSVVDELKSSVTLSNGSTIESYPASQRQIRGIGADLLIVDEAAFVPRDIWTAAYPSIADRVQAGARVILASTPWPLADSWFYEWYQRGRDGAEHVSSWYWPSSVNPRIGEAELADLRAGLGEEAYEREVLALWSSESGAYFEPEEIEAAVADYEAMSPERARAASSWDYEAKRKERQFSAVCGVDYGFAADANVATVIAAVDDRGCNPRVVHYVAWAEAHYRLEYAAFVDKMTDIGRSYRVHTWASEVNGVGAAPTQDLRRRLREEGLSGYVFDVWTDHRRKQAGFSRVKSMMQGGTLVLPRDPDLMRELRSLDFTRTDAGSLRIAARTGFHDDRAMSLMQAVSCLRDVPNPESTLGPMYPHTVTGRGVVMPRKPRPREYWSASFTGAQGAERAGAAW